ncbi:MAG: hypothetical protein JWO36_2613 [Myxococcales bacterium]|nr:hypothetical protein [Myxococcales bacterium]
MAGTLVVPVVRFGRSAFPLHWEKGDDWGFDLPSLGLLLR